GGRVDGGHVVLVAERLVQDPVAAVCGGARLVEKPATDDMPDGEPAIAGRRLEQRRDRLIERSRAERAAHYSDDEPVVWKPERGTRGCTVALPIDGEHRLAYRRAGVFGARQGRVRKGGGTGDRPAGGHL